MASKKLAHHNGTDRPKRVSASVETQRNQTQYQQVAPAASVHHTPSVSTATLAQNILHLQRTIGNRAVGRHLTHTATTTGLPATARAVPASLIQRAAVTTKRGKVDQRILEEVLAIVNAAEAQGGKDRSGPMLQSLQDVLAKEKVKELDPGSRQTYGISGASFFPGTQTLAVQGAEPWREAVKEASDTSPLDLGQRGVGLHDEMHHITEYPGVQAVLSTQNNCLFCYGLLEIREYQHGPLRDTPWPKMWKHDYLKFTLTQTNKQMDAISTNPVIEISTKWGTAYYLVDDHAG